MLSKVKAAGFDFVRLTVSPDIFLASDAERRLELFALAKARAGQIAAAGLSVIFDLHPIGLNPDFTGPKIVEAQSAPAFRAYVDLVEQAARALDGWEPGTVAFELMNEPQLIRPAEMARWPSMLAELHDRARAAAPHLTLVISGANWGDRSTLRQIDAARYRGSDVIYTFHYYDPHVYTHQGFPAEEAVRYLAGLAWPGSSENARAVLAAAERRIAEDQANDAAAKARIGRETDDAVRGFAAGNFNLDRIRADFGGVAGWARANGISPDRVLLGEFGARAIAGGIPTPGYLDWIASVRKAAEEAGFSWAFWSYEGYRQFGITDGSGGLERDILNALGLQG